MALVGRPSAACRRCRVRRIKCNKQRPSCSQCHSARVPCPGYQDDNNSLRFQDETNTTVQKHAPLQPRSLAVQVRHGEAIKTASSLSKETLTADIVLKDSLVNAALKYLLDSFVDGSHFHYIPAMCRDISPSDRDVFASTVRTLALAAFSNHVADSALMRYACELYTQTLRTLKASLTNADSATSDKVLASVLLLSRFEAALTHNDELTIFQSWAQHIRGALAVIQQRGGRQNLDTPRSRFMLYQTLYNLNQYYMIAGVSRPKVLVEVASQLINNSQEGEEWDHYRLKLHVATDSYSNLRRLMRESAYGNSKAIVEEAENIDAYLSNLQAEVSTNSSYVVIKATDSCPPRRGYEGVTLHRDTYHVYKTHHEARLWNFIRMLRLTLHEIRVDTLKEMQKKPQPNSSDGKQESTTYEVMSSPLVNGMSLETAVRESSNAVNELVDAICASVPQFLRPGYPDCTVLTASQLIWPMFVAARVAPVRCFDFVRDRLEWIKETLNIHSATLAIERLTRDFEYRDDWLRVTSVS